VPTLLRAALVRLDRWVSAEEPPPPSRYPRLSDGTAVLPESTADVFSGIPGMRFPAHLPRAARNDFGPEANRGIVTTLPPLPGKPYPCFVPAIATSSILGQRWHGVLDPWPPRNLRDVLAVRVVHRRPPRCDS